MMLLPVGMVKIAIDILFNVLSYHLQEHASAKGEGSLQAVYCISRLMRATKCQHCKPKTPLH